MLGRILWVLALAGCTPLPVTVVNPPGFAPAYPDYVSVDWQRANGWRYGAMER